MTKEQRNQLISEIFNNMKFWATELNKPFCEGDTLFSLAFKSDRELKKIAKLAGL